MTAVVAPGGSIRDQEIVAAADQRQMAFLLAPRRHFRHCRRRASVLLHSLLLLGALPRRRRRRGRSAGGGRAALRRAATLYSDGCAHAASFAQTYTPAGFANARRESGTVWIQAPQRLRFDYAAPDKKVFTYDAGEGRFYSPEDRQLTVRKLSAEERARLPIVFLTIPQELAATTRSRSSRRRRTASRCSCAPASAAAGARLAPLARRRRRQRSRARLRGRRRQPDRVPLRVLAHGEAARPAADYRVVGPKGRERRVAVDFSTPSAFRNENRN